MYAYHINPAYISAPEELPFTTYKSQSVNHLKIKTNGILHKGLGVQIQLLNLTTKHTALRNSCCVPGIMQH